MNCYELALNVLLEFPDREMRPVDIWDYLKSTGKYYAGPGNISVALARLHRDGLAFRVKDGLKSYYCIAREMR